MNKPIHVTIWNEGRHEKISSRVARIYPAGIHGAIAAGLPEPDFKVSTALLDDPDHGLSADVLAQTDVLLWWGHLARDEVTDSIVELVHHRVLDGMGLIVLHSCHFSKIFLRLMGTTYNLKWREAGERERIWVLAPDHPIAQGLGEYIEIESEEMYGEPFDIPARARNLSNLSPPRNSAHDRECGPMGGPTGWPPTQFRQDGPTGSFKLQRLNPTLRFLLHPT